MEVSGKGISAALEVFTAPEGLERRAKEIFQALLNDSQELAWSVVDGLLEQTLGPKDEVLFEELRQLPIQVGDVEEAWTRLHREVLSARTVGDGSLPCMEVDRAQIPVDFLPNNLIELDYHYHYHWVVGHLVAHAPRVKWIPWERAVRNAAGGLTDFLKVRLASWRFWRMTGGSAAVAPGTGVVVGGMGTASQMLNVVVHSATSGARVSYSPAYFVNFMVLAAPTTPVSGVLMPGRYIFRVGTTRGEKPDPGVFDVPPAFNIHLLV